MAGMFSAVRGNKISQQIISQIRGMIYEGKLAAGDKLPPENVLTERFGVSRQTLREALRTLEFLGLVEIKKGTSGGPRIAEMDSAIAQETLANYLYFKNLSIGQALEFRLIVEPRAASIAATTLTDAELRELSRIVDASKNASLDSADPWDTARADIEFHRLIGQSARNPILAFAVGFIETVMEEIARSHPIEKSSYAEIVAAHERILGALRSGNADKAGAEMYAHIESDRNLVASAMDTGVWQRRKPNDTEPNREAVWRGEWIQP